MTIIHLQGRMMVNVKAGDNTLDFYLDELTSGHYFVKLESNDRKVNEIGKLLVIR